MKKIFLLLVGFYIKFISPFLSVYLGKACRFSPSCSVYTIQSIEKYGIKGILLAIKRVLRCNWSSSKFYDPVV